MRDLSALFLLIFFFFCSYSSFCGWFCSSTWLIGFSVLPDGSNGMSMNFEGINEKWLLTKCNHNFTSLFGCFLRRRANILKSRTIFPSQAFLVTSYYFSKYAYKFEENLQSRRVCLTSKSFIHSPSSRKLSYSLLRITKNASPISNWHYYNVQDDVYQKLDKKKNRNLIPSGGEFYPYVENSTLPVDNEGNPINLDFQYVHQYRNNTSEYWSDFFNGSMANVDDFLQGITPKYAYHFRPKPLAPPFFRRFVKHRLQKPQLFSKPFYEQYLEKDTEIGTDGKLIPAPNLYWTPDLKLRITITGHYHKDVARAMIMLREGFERMPKNAQRFLHMTNPRSYRKKSYMWSFLRSPFADGHSREQIGLEVHKKTVDIFRLPIPLDNMICDQQTFSDQFPSNCSTSKLFENKSSDDIVDSYFSYDSDTEAADWDEDSRRGIDILRRRSYRGFVSYSNNNTTNPNNRNNLDNELYFVRSEPYSNNQTTSDFSFSDTSKSQDTSNFSTSERFLTYLESLNLEQIDKMDLSMVNKDNPLGKRVYDGRALTDKEVRFLYRLEYPPSSEEQFFCRNIRNETTLMPPDVINRSVLKEVVHRVGFRRHRYSRHSMAAMERNVMAEREFFSIPVSKGLAPCGIANCTYCESNKIQSLFTIPMPPSVNVDVSLRNVENPTRNENIKDLYPDEKWISKYFQFKSEIVHKSNIANELLTERYKKDTLLSWPKNFQSLRALPLESLNKMLQVAKMNHAHRMARRTRGLGDWEPPIKIFEENGRMINEPEDFRHLPDKEENLVVTNELVDKCKKDRAEMSQMKNQIKAEKMKQKQRERQMKKKEHSQQVALKGQRREDAKSIRKLVY